MKRKYGSGHISEKGYIRRWVNDICGHRMEHRQVWEKANGTIPSGYFIHHKNGNKQDNSIKNLELVDAVTHKRIHSGCKLVNKIWLKQCRRCKEWKEINKTNFYFTKQGWISSNLCRPCYIKKMIRYKQQRKLRED